MRHLAIAAVFAALGAAVAACASDGVDNTGDPRVCFRPSEIDDWGQQGALLFNVRSRRGDVYQGRFRDICPEVDWTQRLSLQPHLGSRRVCPGAGATLVFRDTVGTLHRCVVDDFRLLTPEERSRLPERLRS